MKIIKFYKWRLTIGIILLLLIALRIFWILYEPRERNDGALVKTILWWTRTMPSDYESRRFCGIYICRFTSNRNHLPFASVVIFYAPDMKISDFPLPRNEKQLWALLHDESPRNVPYIQFPEVLQHFNYTSTFSRYSNFPLTTQFLPSISDLISPIYKVGPEVFVEDIATTVFIQSDCDTMSGREHYVKELMQFIRIDSFGQCLKNRDLPKHLQKDYLNNLYSSDLFRFLKNYKFIISIENGVCNDYITEKYWRPLLIGVIPIYFGSPTIRDWEPNNKSAIYIDDFESPKALAQFLNNLSINDPEYRTYLQHKMFKKEQIHKRITNQRLLDTILTRDYPNKESNLFWAFEKYICSSRFLYYIKNIATKDHYHCEYPLKYPRMENEIINNKWESIMNVGYCQAQVLNFFLKRNESFTQQEFDEILSTHIRNRQCD